MKTFETSWKSKDGLDIFAQGWEPEGKPKAVVCLVHGLGEHSGRYAHVGAAFAGAGFVLTGFDLRGHGKSGGPRGHSPIFENFMQDIDLFLAQSRQRYPGLPVFLYGHSLGAILVLNYALRRKPDLAGVISTAASLRNALEEQKAKVAMAKLFGSVLPTMAIASGLDPTTISRDSRVVQAYVDDPLVHDRLSFGMGKQLLEAIAYAFAHAPEFSVPLLIMHGAEDALGYPSGSQEFAELVPGDCVLKLWDGLYHEIHNEPEKDEVFKFIFSWLDRHLPAK